MVNKIINGSTEKEYDACLVAINYICEDISSNILKPQSNVILSAIIQGMLMKSSNHTQLTASNTLLNFLDSIKAHFEEEWERSLIMQVVCDIIQSPEVIIRVAALQCLVKIKTCKTEPGINLGKNR